MIKQIAANLLKEQLEYFIIVNSLNKKDFKKDLNKLEVLSGK